MSCSFSPFLILGAEPDLNNLSEFRGPPHKSGVSIGYDLEVDERRGCTISDKGIVVIPEGMVIELD
jgi:hypothetical protein